jgi:hypothetical protein
MIAFIGVTSDAGGTGEYGAAGFVTKPADFEILKTQLPVYRPRTKQLGAVLNDRSPNFPGTRAKVGFGA